MPYSIAVSDMKLENIFKNVTDIEDTLVTNFSIPQHSADVLMNSRINFTEVCLARKLDSSNFKIKLQNLFVE